MSQQFYRAFEDRYRGSRDVIKQRLRAYASFLEPLAKHTGDALDLGCGRGEWLELLAEYGFAAHGVDLDEGMLAACRERGLDVENRDALNALRARPDNSLALVSAFHLIEHIPFEMVQDIIGEALRALRPGGLLILETPNPENLVVGATSFYLDPSHLHPIPPGLLAFATEHGGFGRQRVLRLQEPAQLRDQAMVGLIDVLEGVSPDYSVVAQKTAEGAVLIPFDAAFAAPRGLELGLLAQRYETARAHQHAEIHHILERIERQNEQDRIATQAAEAAAQQRYLALEQRLERAEHGLVLAEQRGRQIVDLLESTSWRVTAPLRMVGALLLRLRAARRDGRLLSGVRRRVLVPVRSLLKAVLRRPRWKRAAMGMLRYMPRLRARLQMALYSSDVDTPSLPPQANTPGDLSPRAADIYRELMQALEAKKN